MNWHWFVRSNIGSDYFDSILGQVIIIDFEVETWESMGMLQGLICVIDSTE